MFVGEGVWLVGEGLWVRVGERSSGRKGFVHTYIYIYIYIYIYLYIYI